MVIAARLIDDMVEHARREFPNEACGLVAAQNGQATRVYPIKNTLASPVAYEMDSQEQLRAMLEIDDRDWELGAIYHSHTRTRAYPSDTDVRVAQYPDALYIIVSLAHDEMPEVKAFRIVEGKIDEQTLEILGT